MTLLARNGGLATHEVVTAGASIQDDALLVLAGEPRPFASLGADELDDELLRGAWRALVLLGGLGIAHQQLDPSKVVVSAARRGLVDFGGAEAAANELQLTTDRAQLLVTTVGLAGGERALRAAIDVDRRRRASRRCSRTCSPRPSARRCARRRRRPGWTSTSCASRRRRPSESSRPSS